MKGWQWKVLSLVMSLLLKLYYLVNDVTKSTTAKEIKQSEQQKMEIS